MREYKKKLKDNSSSEFKLYLTSPYPAPPIIEKVWDLLILYTEHYERFISHVFYSLAMDVPLSFDKEYNHEERNPYSSSPTDPYIFLDKP